jgi:acetyl-CoA acyltransferase
VERAFVIGVGMTKFEKPGRREWDYPEMVKEAATAALEDASVGYEEIEQVCAGFVYADSTAGERASYELGLTGVPIQNLNNNCATGSSALFYARQLVQGGLAQAVLAFGFERMARGSLPESVWPDKAVPAKRHTEISDGLFPGPTDAPVALRLFGNAAREHMDRYGTTPVQLARVAAKNHQHSVNNPFAQFQDSYSVEEVLDSTLVYEPLTKLQCSPTSDGAAAAVIGSERFVDQHDLWPHAVEILAQAMVTDLPSSFEDFSAISVVGKDMSARAATQVYEQAQITPDDLDVIELHDCFSINELITYEALGLCAEGESGALVDSGAVDYGGKWVVNPSGGLISKGHPLGATGLAQASELTWQLRGQAGDRQVPKARLALQHNIGLGGAAVVTLYAQPT